MSKGFVVVIIIILFVISIYSFQESKQKNIHPVIVTNSEESYEDKEGTIELHPKLSDIYENTLDYCQQQKEREKSFEECIKSCYGSHNCYDFNDCSENKSCLKDLNKCIDEHDVDIDTGIWQAKRTVNCCFIGVLKND